MVNADIPTVPPTLRAKQAKQLEQALQDDPDAPAIREQMRRQEIRSEDEEAASSKSEREPKSDRGGRKRRASQHH